TPRRRPRRYRTGRAYAEPRRTFLPARLTPPAPGNADRSTTPYARDDRYGPPTAQRRHDPPGGGRSDRELLKHAPHARWTLPMDPSVDDAAHAALGQRRAANAPAALLAQLAAATRFLTIVPLGGHVAPIGESALFFPLV